MITLCVCIYLYTYLYTYLYRTDVQCRDKWMNNLDPTLNHSPHYAAIEDKMLIQLVQIFGLGE